MNKMLLAYFYIVVGVVLILAFPAWADLQAGVNAYERGDYDMALAEFRPLGDQGDAVAQYNLGVMYDNGQGVPQDYQEAEKWYRRAADQGVAQAQSNLAMMYYSGQGVPQDYVLAHMWANLAASHGNEGPVEIRNIIATKMTPAQIAEAQRLAREWKPKGK